jgi:hypothetical protein
MTDAGKNVDEAAYPEALAKLVAGLEYGPGWTSCRSRRAVAA